MVLSEEDSREVSAVVVFAEDSGRMVARAFLRSDLMAIFSLEEDEVDELFEVEREKSFLRGQCVLDSFLTGQDMLVSLSNARSEGRNVRSLGEMNCVSGLVAAPWCVSITRSGR